MASSETVLDAGDARRGAREELRGPANRREGGGQLRPAGASSPARRTPSRPMRSWAIRPRSGRRAAGASATVLPSARMVHGSQRSGTRFPCGSVVTSVSKTVDSTSCSSMVRAAGGSAEVTGLARATTSVPPSAVSSASLPFGARRSISARYVAAFWCSPRRFATVAASERSRASGSASSCARAASMPALRPAPRLVDPPGLPGRFGREQHGGHGAPGPLSRSKPSPRLRIRGGPRPGFRPCGKPARGGACASPSGAPSPDHSALLHVLENGSRDPGRLLGAEGEERFLRELQAVLDRLLGDVAFRVVVQELRVDPLQPVRVTLLQELGVSSVERASASSARRRCRGRHGRFRSRRPACRRAIRAPPPEAHRGRDARSRRPGRRHPLRGSPDPGTRSSCRGPKRSRGCRAAPREVVRSVPPRPAESSPAERRTRAPSRRRGPAPLCRLFAIEPESRSDRTSSFVKSGFPSVAS